MNVDEDIPRWTRLADTELATAKYLLETRRPMPCEIICNLSQQAAEKIIKGFLYSRGIRAPKTRDLRELCDLCVDIEAGFGSFGREAVSLTSYGVLPRYPNELDLEEHDAETAVKYAERIVAFVKPLLDKTSET